MMQEPAFASQPGGRVYSSLSFARHENKSFLQTSGNLFVSDVRYTTVARGLLHFAFSIFCPKKCCKEAVKSCWVYYCL